MLCAIGPELEALNLSRHESITDEFLENGLGKWTGSLERLSLAACPEITDRAVSRLFSAWAGGEAKVDGADDQQVAAMPNDVNGPVRSRNKMGRSRRPVTRRPMGARATAKNDDVPPCQNVALVAIEMGRNHLLSSRSLISIMRHSGTRLESLNMNGWKDVTTESLQELGNYAQELRKLDVGWCRNVDDFVLAGWVGFNIPTEGSDKVTSGRCLKLSEIKVWGCNRVTAKFPIRVSRNIINMTGTHSCIRGE
jgi:DNA repair protein RAD7